MRRDSRTPMRALAAFGFAVFAFAAGASGAVRGGGCNQAAKEAVTFVEVPGRPFSAIPTRDGCWVFVSLWPLKAGAPKGIGVVERRDGKAALVRVVPTEGEPLGMVLTRDEKLAIVAGWDRLVFADVGRMISGAENAVLGYLKYEDRPGSIYVNVTPDDRTLFVSEERMQAITVIDLEKARVSGFDRSSILGKIPVWRAPIALTFSPDGRRLYTTSQVALPEAGWPAECAREGGDAASKLEFPQGAVMVVDVARARSDPVKAMVAAAPAGCNPVRLALSPKGDIAYVTARGNHAVLALDTGRIARDPRNAVVGRVPAGTSPVGIVVADKGRKVIATSSSRFSGGTAGQQVLTVIDAKRTGEGAAAAVGKIRAGSFPRELKLTADGRTLLVTNFASNTLELVDLNRLERAAPQTEPRQ